MSGGNFDIRKDEFTDLSLVEGFFINELETENQLKVLSELSVGSQVLGRESVFGEGDSTSENLLAWTDNAAENNKVDVTEDLKFNEGTTTATFQNNAVGEIIYIGSDAVDSGDNPIQFLGIKTSLIVPALETDQIIDFEYWNGVAWLSFNFMVTQGNPPFFPFAKRTFTNSSEQIRFDRRIAALWQTNDPVGLGRNRYWVRMVLNQVVAQLPVLDQVKNHTNRREINANGWPEYFGQGRPRGQLAFTTNNFAPANQSPANQDFYLSDRLGVGRVENEFQDGQTDRIALGEYLPFDIDTSCPVTVKIIYTQSNTATGNVQLNLIWDLLTDGGTVYLGTGPAPPASPNQQELNEIFAVPGLQVAETIEFEIDLSEAFARRVGGFGDLLVLAIERNANLVADTYAGDFIVLQVGVFYTKWSDGGYE